jgi:type IV pilus assembly protein PilM
MNFNFFKKIADKFFTSKFPMIGVDISDSSIEFFQLEKGPKQPKIKMQKRIEIPPGIVVKNQIKDLSRLAEILKQAYTEGADRFLSNFCLLALPDKLTYFLKLALDPQGDFSRVYSLAQEKLPVNLAECYYDFLKINENEVFFAASEKEITDQYKELFVMAGLNLAVIDFESACLIRSLIQADIKPVFIIDLGAETTDIILYDQQGFRDQINFAIGGHDLTKIIAQDLGLSLDKAEVQKRKEGLNILKQKNKAIEIFQPIFQEIIKMKNNYELKDSQKVEKVILAGGTSLVPGLIEIFTAELHLKVELGNPFLKLDAAGSQFKADKILYGNVIGLALRGLNSDSLRQGINLINK